MIIKTKQETYDVQNVVTGDRPTCTARIKEGDAWQDVNDTRARELLARIVMQQMEEAVCRKK